MSAAQAYLEGDYSLKEPLYYGSPRRDYVERLPPARGVSVLELGCGDGATGALALREGKCARYVGIEMFAPMAERAQRVLSAVHTGNVETMQLPYPPASFDVLILSEVLEHLVDPAPTLRRLVSLLRIGGLVLASSPNVSHWCFVRDLLRGSFDYTDSGPSDRTHLRWFTPRTFAAMFEQAGVSVSRLAPLPELTWKWGIVSTALGPRFQHLLWYQIDLTGRRAT